MRLQRRATGVSDNDGEFGVDLLVVTLAPPRVASGHGNDQKCDRAQRERAVEGPQPHDNALPSLAETNAIHPTPPITRMEQS